MRTWVPALLLAVAILGPPAQDLLFLALLLLGSGAGSLLAARLLLAASAHLAGLRAKLAVAGVQSQRLDGPSESAARRGSERTDEILDLRSDLDSSPHPVTRPV